MLVGKEEYGVQVVKVVMAELIKEMVKVEKQEPVHWVFNMVVE